MKGIRKRIFGAIIAICLLLTIFPFTAMAAGEFLDFYFDPTTRSGNNWTWDQETSTLTLSGVNLTSIILPDSSTIVLSAGSNNSITTNISHGILCGGNLAIIGGGNLSIKNTLESNAIYTYGSLSINDCGDINIESAGEGIVSGINTDEAVLSIERCKSLSIAAMVFGAHSFGSIIIADCPDIDISALGYGIASDNGGITIANSNVSALDASYGIITGLYAGTGGDIVIANSTVYVNCIQNGDVAIFAGDDVWDDEGQHARILLNGCVIGQPAGGRILNVDIYGKKCQSITHVTSIPVITEVEHFAKSVLITPQGQSPKYSVTYSLNGATGTAPVDAQWYYTGSIVNPLSGDNLNADGYSFIGWQFADGTPVPDSFVMGSEDITLYAVWGIKPPNTGDVNSMLGFSVLLIGFAIMSTLLLRKNRD